MSFPKRSLSVFLFAFAASIFTIAQTPQPAPDPATLPGGTQLAPSPSRNAKSGPAQPSVVVVLDSSAGRSGHFAQMRDAATRFINSLGDERDVAVIAAADKPVVVADFNSDPEKVTKQIEKIKPRGTPALRNAIAIAAQRAAAESDSAAVVVFARNPEPGPAPQNAAPPNSSVPVYVIASPDSKWNVQAQMQQVAVKSGGTAFFPSNDRELRDVVKETAARVEGHPNLDGHSVADKNLLRGYERLIVREIPVDESPATAEAGGGENLLMQQVLVARIRKAKLFPVVVNGADQHAVDSAAGSPIGNALELRATVVEFRRGNKAQRQFLAGVKGRAKMKLRVILVDTSTNQPVLAFTKEASYASGLWGGSPEHVQAQAMLNVANEIVDELKRAR